MPVNCGKKPTHSSDRAMPFSDTFWAKKFGMVTDKFGCNWIVNGELIDIQLQG